MEEIKLGNIVRDQSSGFTGTAVIKHYLMNGMIHYTVQPESPDPDKMADAYEISEVLLVVTHEGIAHLAQPIVDVNDIQVTDRVRDKLTKMEGIVSERLEHISGCVTLRVITEKKGKKSPEQYTVDQGRLEVIMHDAVEQVETPRRGSFRQKAPR